MGNRMGGESIDEQFADENFKLKLTAPGLLFQGRKEGFIKHHT